MIKSVYKKTNGAVLLAVLIISVVLSILFGIVTKILEQRLELAITTKNFFENNVKVYSSKNEISYLIATQRISIAGVSQGIIINENQYAKEESVASIIGDELRTDGVMFKNGQGVEIYLQDTSGLIGFNSSGHYWVKKWLVNNGLSEFMANRYIGALADYVDPDDWQRPTGLEQNQQGYQPQNYLLQNCNELHHIHFWQTLAVKNPAIIEACSTSRSTILNLNATPLKLLKKLWPNYFETIQTKRDNGEWFKSMPSIINVIPPLHRVNDELYTTYGGKEFNLTLKLGGAKTAVNINRGLGKAEPVNVKLRPI
jgi:general secretion pathway protein K